MTPVLAIFALVGFVGFLSQAFIYLETRRELQKCRKILIESSVLCDEARDLWDKIVVHKESK